MRMQSLNATSNKPANRLPEHRGDWTAEHYREYHDQLNHVRKTLGKEIATHTKKTNLKNMRNNIQRTIASEHVNMKRFFQSANDQKCRSAKRKGEMRTASVTDANGHVQIEREPSKVRAIVQQFWQTLFTRNARAPATTERRATGPQAIISDNAFPLLKEEELIEASFRENMSSLTSAITMEELSAHIAKLGNDKAAGPDTVAGECFKLLKDNGREALLQLLNCVMRTKQAPSSWKHSNIFLIHKEGDTSDCANYRPITLCSVGYKLFTSILTTRLTKLVEEHTLLTDSQAGFRPHRSTTQKITELTDMIKLAAKGKQPLHVCYIDLRKAYDSVSHEGLWTTLRAMHISDDFITLLQALYSDNTAQVITPHGLTDHVHITRGLRQGCPLSPLLFVLLLEPLLQRIHQDPRCEGFPCRKIVNGNGLWTNLKALAYADDVALVAQSRQSLQRALDLFSEFCNYHGMTIAVDRADAAVKLKTVYTCMNDDSMADAAETIHVTSPDGSTTSVPRIAATQHYRYLGVWISLSLDWSKHIAEVDAKVVRYTNFLTNRCFTAAQCVLALNRILAPRASYGFTVVDVPERKLKSWDKRIASTVHRKLRMTTLRSPNMLHATCEQGGLALLSLRHLHTALHYMSTYQALNNLDGQTAEAARTVWERCTKKQKNYGAMFGNGKFNIQDRRSARQEEGATSVYTYLNEQTRDELGASKLVRERLLCSELLRMCERIPLPAHERRASGYEDEEQDPDYTDAAHHELCGERL
jgi:hypothetical protein